MSINEEERHALHDRLVEVLGRSEASTLMAGIPPLGWGDVATRRDLDLVRVATKTDLAVLEATLRGEMAHLRDELRGEMAHLRDELRGEMADLRIELRTGLAAMEVTLHRELRRAVYLNAGITAAMLTLGVSIAGLLG
jgi:hypothetical protein